MKPSAGNNRKKSTLASRMRFPLLVGSSLALVSLAFMQLLVHRFSVAAEQVFFDQILDQNREIGLSVIQLISDEINGAGDFDEVRTRLSQVCERVSLPNGGYLCAVAPSGKLIAARGVGNPDLVDLRHATFFGRDHRQQIAFEEFFKTKEFSGFYDYPELEYSDLLFAITHPQGFKLCVHQNAGMVQDRAVDALTPVSEFTLPVSLGFGGVVFLMVGLQGNHFADRIAKKNLALEAMLDQSQRQSSRLAEQSGRIETAYADLKELSRLVVHDLKNPVGNLQSLVELLRGGNPGSKHASELVELMDSSCGEAMEQINRVLSLGRMNGYVVETREVDLADLVSDCVRAFRGAAELKRINIEMALPEETCVVESDRTLIGSVVENLISNAIKFSPPGATVSVSIRVYDQSFRLLVSDQGPGFTEEDQRRVFSQGGKQSAKPTGREVSHGLGLISVYNLCRRLGIEMTLDSKVGVGSTLSVDLPRGGVA